MTKIEEVLQDETENKVLEENGIPQNIEETVDVENSSKDEIQCTSDAETTEEEEAENEPVNKVHDMQSPDVGKGPIVAKRNINYSCRTTCRANVVVVTVMRDGTEDCLTFVCNLKW